MVERKKNRRKLVLAMAAGQSLIGGALAMATSYTWASPAASGTWQNMANWNPNTGTPSMATDSALLDDATANRTVTFATGAVTTTIGTLTLNQSDPDLNLLDLQIGNGGTLAVSSNVTLGASGGGTASIFVDTYSTSGNHVNSFAAPSTTLDSGGVLELGLYDNTGGIIATSQVGGNVTVAGGTFYSDRGQVAVAADSNSNKITGSLTMTSGTISIGSHPASGLSSSLGGSIAATVDRLVVGGNLTISGGTFITGTAAVADTSGDELYLSGATNSISGLSGAVTPFVVLNTNVNQSLLSDSALPGGVSMRGTGTNQSYSIGTATPGGSLSIGTQIRFQASAASPTLTLNLASNIGSNGSLAINSGGTVLDTFGINLNGFTLDFTPAAKLEALPNYSTYTAYNISNSGGSASPGIFKAMAFDLSAPTKGNTIGSYVNLVATGVGTTSILSNTYGGSIDPASTFNFAGTATGVGSLISSRTIGNLAVTSQTLNLGSAISTGTTSAVTIASAGTLNLNGFALSTPNFTNSGGVLAGSTAGSSLSVTGAFSGTGTVGAAAGIAAGTSSGGSLSPGGVGTVGNLTVSSGSGALTLGSGNTSNFDIAGASSFDTMMLNSVAVTFAGTLNLNFLSGYAPTQGQTFTIFSGLPAGETTNFNSITSNLSGYTFDFNDSSGVLTVDSVPEPTSLALLGTSALLVLRRRRRGS